MNIFIILHHQQSDMGMKVILVIAILFLFMVSCKRNEAVFSCDPTLNEYISTHTVGLKSLSLYELTKSDLAFQQAVFRSYDAAKKREVWLQKIQLLLDNQNYTEAEYAHVASLLNHLHENYFEPENIASEALVRRQFAVDWISKAKTNLGWSDKGIAFVIYRLYTNQIQFDSEINASQTDQIEIGDPSGNCSCSTASDYCITNRCNSGSCNITTGCGWLWSETCDGKCS